jgi:hypothetical protein
VNAVNGTDLALECTPARNFVRRFMAPDFENPQLVRRLDWFHDDSLVANYQQVHILLQKNYVSQLKFKMDN